MDGSVADTTRLRMRSGLERHSHSSPSLNKGEQSFFEELLKVPIAQSKDASEDDLPEEPVAAKTDSQTSDASSKPKAANEDESISSDEEDSEASVTVCTMLPGNPTNPPVVEPVAEPKQDSSSDVKPAAVTSNQVAVQDTVADAADVTKEAVVADQAVEETAVKRPGADDAIGQESLVNKDVATRAVSPNDKPVSSKDLRVEKKRDADVVKAHEEPVNANAIQPEQAVARPAQEETKSPDARESKASDSAQITEESPRAEADSKESNRAKWYEGRESSSLGDALAQASATDTQSSDAHDDTPADALNQLVDKAVQSADSQLSDSGSVIDNMSSTTLDSAAMNSAASALAAVAGTSSGVATNGGETSATGSNSSIAAPGAATGSAASGRSGTPNSTNGVGFSTSVTQTRTTGSPGEGVHGERKADGESVQLNQQERVRLVQRVARSFSRLGPEGGQVTLKLHPPELGVLNVSIRIDGQTMSARLQTETSAARDVILENLPVLKDRLSEQGIEVEKFQVDVSGGNADLAGGSNLASNSQGDSNGPSNSGSSSIDYRRLSRAAAVRSPILTPNPAFVGSSLPQGRSLDVKA